MTKKEKLVSVIVPVYNAEKFLDKTLKSLTIQSIDVDFAEIILVNDGSKDRSLEICQAFAKNNENIIVIDQQNTGVSGARNVGLERATGKYVTFVDSDDYVAKDYFETILNVVKSEKEFYCLNNYIIGPNGASIEKGWLPNAIKKGYDYNDFFKICVDAKLNVPWDKIFLNSVIKENNIKFDSRITMAEDYLFNVNYLTCVSKVEFVDYCIYFHELNPDGLCGKKRDIDFVENYVNVYNELKKFENRVQNKELFLDIIKISTIRSITNFFFGLMVQGKSKKELKDYCKKSDVIKECTKIGFFKVLKISGDKKIKSYFSFS